MKYNVLLFVLLAALILVSCGTEKDETTNEVVNMTVVTTQTPTDVPAYQPPSYTEAEIQAAIDVAKAKFDADFADCQMLRLEFIDGKYQSDYEYYARRCAVDRVIVLESDYTTGPDVSPSLNANHTYHNWKWILIDDGSGWRVWTSGYG